jgi:hypothetical protein
VALVAKAAEQCADESFVAEEVGPLGVEIGCDDGGALPVPLLHQLEEDVGLLGPVTLSEAIYDWLAHGGFSEMHWQTEHEWKTDGAFSAKPF